MSPAGSAEWRVPVGAVEVGATFEPAGATQGIGLFLCAHGAGGHRGDRGVLAVSEAVRARGIDVVRFNFPYSEKRSGRPDHMPVLKATVAAVAERARAETRARRIVIGGRSMGGRAASMLAADGFACDGLLLLAYPLHPAGNPEKLRDAHLSAIGSPVLCVNGTRDPLCTKSLMDAAVTPLAPRWTMHWLHGADHSFHVLKSSGTTDAAVLDDIGATAERWMKELS